MTQIVVLCGGLGTRMLPASEHTPKVLLEIAGRPFLDHLLDRFAASGFTEALLLVGHLAERVERHVADRALPLPVQLAVDPPGPRGTGRALIAARERLANDFVLTYGDAWPSIDPAAPLATLRADPNALGCMLVTPISRAPTAVDRPNTRVQGRYVARYEKGVLDAELDHLDAGVLALRKGAVLEARGPDLADLQRDLASRGALLAHHASAPTFELGSPEGRIALENALRTKLERPA
jgi:N-acetyl-alpha-D-muramate 1-phosphate uridylyltransferase